MGLNLIASEDAWPANQHSDIDVASLSHTRDHIPILRRKMTLHNDTPKFEDFQWSEDICLTNIEGSLYWISLL